MLMIPRLRKDDAGVYRCLVEGIHGEFHSSAVELKVADYVPTFNGNTVIEVTPLEADEWQRIQIELSVRPTSPDGTLYHAERSKVFHTIELKRGHVVYSYDIGGGFGRLQSNNVLPMNEWSKILVKNNPSKVSLNVNGQESNFTTRRQIPVLLDEGDSAVYIGGLNSNAKSGQNFKGSISRLVINDKLIDIGESATSPPELTLSLSSNECFDEPCLNAGFCTPAHEHEGYRCECDAEFTGSHCQFKTRICANNAECVTGICVDGDWGSTHCVCPLRRYGERCELENEQEETKQGIPFKFNGHSSFLSIPTSQKTSRISMTLRPNQTSTRQLIAYVASGYNTQKSDYLALTIEDGYLVGTYKTKDGHEKLRSLSAVEANRNYEIGVLRSGKSFEIRVDGQFSGATVESFPSTGTQLFIGGLPPGMKPNQDLQSYEFFSGCIGNVQVNRQLIDFEAEDSVTGDLQPCIEPSLEAQSTPVYDTQPRTLLYGSSSPEVLQTAPDDSLIITTKETVKQEEGFVDEPSVEPSIASTEDLEIETTTTSTVEPTAKTTISAPTQLLTSTEQALIEDQEFLDLEPTEEPSVNTPTISSQKQTDTLSISELSWRPIRIHDADSIPAELRPENLCNDEICGEHGTCEPMNLTHVICSCRDYYTGPNCQVFKPIENAARFEGNAFIVFSVDEFPHLTSETRESIEFELRTNSDQGLIFWQGQSPHSDLAGEDYVSLGLSDGHLVYAYELGGGAAQLVSREPLNDGKVHKIRVEREGRNGTLQIDNGEILHGKSSGILAMLNVEGNLYLGGLPNLLGMTAGLHSQNFVGCLADFRLNDRKLDLMANAIDGRNVKPCDEWERQKRRRYYRRRLRTRI